MAWLNSSVLLLPLLIFFLIVDLILTGLLVGLTKSDWGVWVGSIGTVGTLIGTIVLSTSGNRRAQRVAEDRAFMAVSSLTPRLVDVEKALQNAVEHFMDDFQSGYGYEYGIRASLLQNAGTWSEDEIMPLLILPEHVCARLAAVRGITQSCINRLREYEEMQRSSWFKEAKAENDGRLIGDLVLARDSMNVCRSECARFYIAHRR